MSYLPNFLLLLLLQFFALPSFACSTPPGYTPPTIPELFQKAKAIFIAHVYRTEEKPGPASTDKTQFIIILEGEFRVIEALKGTPPADNKIKAYLSPCGGMLIPGFDYIFFVREEQEIVTWSDGSELLPSIENKRTKELLNTLRQLAAEKSQP